MGQVSQSHDQTGDQLEGGSISLSHSKPTLTQALSHYRPQELIRLEQENNQLQNEIKAANEFQKELIDRVDHLKRCIQENNQKQFVGDRENERLKKMNEQLLREKVEIEFKLSEKIRKLEEEKEQAASPNQSSIGMIEGDGQEAQNREKRVSFVPEEFEKEMQNVRNATRTSNDMVEQSRKNNFHVSKPMA